MSKSANAKIEGKKNNLTITHKNLKMEKHKIYLTIRNISFIEKHICKTHQEANIKIQIDVMSHDYNIIPWITQTMMTKLNTTQIPRPNIISTPKIVEGSIHIGTGLH